MNIKVIYSNRKTISFKIDDGVLTIRAPYGLSAERIDYYLKKHRRWIDAHMLDKRQHVNELTDAEISALKAEAQDYFSLVTDKFSEIMGLKYGRIRITSAKKRFGSCSAKGNICYSYRLMLYPERAREYVVVHELAHLVHMDHSPAFHRLVESVLPDHKERRKLLK